MSVCTFLAADCPLKEMAPHMDYPVHIDVDRGIIDDGGADDNYFLNEFQDVSSYTDKKYGVRLEWNYTEGRARQILEYIKAALAHTEEVELWHVWLMDYYEYDERPIIRQQKISFEQLSVIELKELDDAAVWNNPDCNRPSFYCLVVER